MNILRNDRGVVEIRTCDKENHVVIILFSYSTPIAVKDLTKKEMVVSDDIQTKTSHKHLRNFQDRWKGSIITIDHRQINDYVENIDYED